MNNFIKLTEEQKDAFFEVVRNLPDNIYPAEGVQSPIEKLNAGIAREGLLAKLLKDVENNNVFLRIVKEITTSKNLDKTVKELIAFYNNPENENIWKKKH